MDDDILRMAREVGATTVDADDPQCWIGSLAFTRQELERFAALVRADEREVCAKRLEAIGCDHCAANVRARNHQSPATVADRLARHGIPMPEDKT